jgi:hypothetical protein
MHRYICLIFALLWANMLSSCEKDARVKEAILGNWVSVDQADTLVFVNEDIFEKNFHPGIMERFTYSIHRDSITVQYSGSNYILVLPTTHKFRLEDNTLWIDFSKGCYGFPKRIMEYYPAVF